MGEQANSTVVVTVFLTGELQDILIAELSDLGFDAFEQEVAFIKAYTPASRWTESQRIQVNDRLRSFGIHESLKEEFIEAYNWNARWEQTIQPVAVGMFLIKPPWANVPSDFADLIVLEIAPKMSFGTGYHESTRLALRLLPPYICKGDRLLDVGTGTGILAIAALKLGAGSALAFDIDSWASNNAVENFQINGVAERAVFREGSMDVVSEDGFDVIAANIIRNVLIDLFPDFRNKTKKGGFLILAGLLTDDRQPMIETATSFGFVLDREATENEWWAGVFISEETG